MLLSLFEIKVIVTIFSVVGDLLPENTIRLGFYPDFAGAILRACGTRQSNISVRLFN